ncbi:MAG: LysR substrate-binding domain-containing protein [Thioalkalivibrionaceae bacterium]
MLRLHHLLSFLAVVENDLSVSRAAQALDSTQPVVSKQLRLLEETLGSRLFQRSGKAFTALTPLGEEVVRHARNMRRERDAILAKAAETLDPESGSLTITTTHTHARYALPPVIEAFRARYPKVRLVLRQGGLQRITSSVERGEADFIIATDPDTHSRDLLLLPAYRWQHVVVVCPNHPLAEQKTLTLKSIAAHPLVTYLDGYSARRRIDNGFQQAGITPNVVLECADADVIKTYVRVGLGIGITAAMAIRSPQDDDLVARPVGHLFHTHVTHVGLRRDAILRDHQLAFLNMLASHLTPELVLGMQGRATPRNTGAAEPRADQFSAADDTTPAHLTLPEHNELPLFGTPPAR